MKSFDTRKLSLLAAALLFAFSQAAAQRSTGRQPPRHRPKAPRSEAIVYASVDRPATFLGNLNAFMEHQIRYPREAREQRQMGKVVLVFGVDADGTVRNVLVHSSSGFFLLDNEALRVARLMPKWSPAERNGRTVKSTQLLPVIFYLDQAQ